MIDLEIELLSQNEEWGLVLIAYQEQQQELQSVQRQQRIQQEEAENPAEFIETAAWLPRIDSVEGVVDEHLARIHGKLIALGLLKFQLAGRTDGVVYQLSHQGKQVLSRLSGLADLESDEPPELAESA